MPSVVSLNWWLHVLNRTWYKYLWSVIYSFFFCIPRNQKIIWFYMPSGINVIKILVLSNSPTFSGVPSRVPYHQKKKNRSVSRSPAELSPSWQEYKCATWWRTPTAVIKYPGLLTFQPRDLNRSTPLLDPQVLKRSSAHWWIPTLSLSPVTLLHSWVVFHLLSWI